MHKVDVYIDIQYKGSFASGTGRYSVVLELVDEKGVPHTREHFGACEGTTQNRLALRACIDALKKFKETCEIDIHIDSSYVQSNVDRVGAWEIGGWISGGKEVKNQDLWKEYSKLAREQLITILNEKHNPYTEAMEIQLRKRDIELIEDRRSE